MLQTKVVEKIKTPILGSVTIFENSAVYGMWKNAIQPHRPQMTIEHGACCVPKATNTHSEHVIHALTALPPRKRPSTHCIGGWVGPRAGVHNVQDNRIPVKYMTLTFTCMHK
jgi:hypothetical protein